MRRTRLGGLFNSEQIYFYVRKSFTSPLKMDFASIQRGKRRQIQKSRRLLHEALVSLIREKKYENITVQQILDRANVGRSTFYLHFRDKDELLSMGFDYMGELLREIQAMHRNSSRKSHENLIAFSLPMFMHMHEFREHSRAFTGAAAGALVSQRIQQMIRSVIDEELNKFPSTGIGKKPNVPRDLFVDHLASTFMFVTMWWLDSETPVTPESANDIYRALVLPSLEKIP